jgi:CrcB protein
MYKNIVCVASGGAMGAVLRYCISLIPSDTDFPFQTFITNITGALAIGFITAFAVLYAERTARKIPIRLLLLFKTGFCGGFTTFSTFALETVTLFEKGHRNTGFIYPIMSLLAGVGAVMLGEFLADLIIG